MVEKKNPDYSGSAVNLCNPPELKKVIEERQSFTSHISNLKTVMEAYPEWEELRKAEIRLADHDKHIRGLIDQYGSYQDPDKGEYALKQRRESILYKPELVRQYAPSKVASFVIIESVDTKAMEAMAKAGQITPEDVRRCGEVKESFVYIIR